MTLEGDIHHRCIKVLVEIDEDLKRQQIGHVEWPIKVRLLGKCRVALRIRSVKVTFEASSLLHTIAEVQDFCRGVWRRRDSAARTLCGDALASVEVRGAKPIVLENPAGDGGAARV